MYVTCSVNMGSPYFSRYHTNKFVLEAFICSVIYRAKAWRKQKKRSFTLVEK